MNALQNKSVVGSRVGGLPACVPAGCVDGSIAFAHGGCALFGWSFVLRVRVFFLS